MFFSSKGKVDAKKIAEMKARASDSILAIGRRTAPLAIPAKQSAAQVDSTYSDSVLGGIHLISHAQDIPPGRYFDFAEHEIPKVWQVNFAIIANHSDLSQLTLLATPDMVATPSYLEIVRRVRNIKPPESARSNSYVLIQQQATREVIKTIHDSEAAARALSGTSTGTSAVQELAWDLVEAAIYSGASDLHIETRTNYAEVLVRVHGQREVLNSISYNDAKEVCNVLYGVFADALSKRTEWTPTKLCDGAISYVVRAGAKAGMSVKLRFSSAPIFPDDANNFHAVIRLLKMESTNVPLAQVGYTEAQVLAIESMIIGSRGMVLLTGPTNSGKSTSMQAMLNRIFEVRGKTTKVITVESPVEYPIPGACQIGISQKDDGSSYNEFVKGMLRQDPDVGMVGEIRSAEDAGAIKDLVLAGRKLLSTLHVSEVVAVYARLRELGVPQSVLFMDGFISGVIYQRLVRVLCPHCSLPIAAANEMGLVRPDVYERVLRVSDASLHDVRIHSKEGCDHCNHRGTVGMTPCAELLIPDHKFLQFMREGNEIAARDYWRSGTELSVDGLGMTAVAHAISKMRKGMLDPHDIETQIDKLEIYRPSNESSGISNGFRNSQSPTLRNHYVQ
jgi:type II secretory ATPase GspE/PulE/Tfp pilus assembly ATPase PilB-like protein